MNTFNTNILARSVDSEILQSMYRRKHKNQGTLNTKLFSELTECFANENKIGEKGFVGFIDNQDIEIITKDGKKILLVAADTGHVNQTLADLISWAVHQVKKSILICAIADHLPGRSTCFHQS
jgi:hypothetical protein